MDEWGAPLSAEERDRLIDKIADYVVQRRLETPTILFLEMHKPVTFFASQGLVVFSPFMAPFVGFGNVQTASRLLGTRENVELLIKRIEDMAAASHPEQGSAPSEGSQNAAR